MSIEQRLGKVEGELSRVCVILEGEPVWDIGENHILRYEGGMEAKLDGILRQLGPRRWTRSQLIKVSMVIVVALGSISTIVWAL